LKSYNLILFFFILLFSISCNKGTVTPESFKPYDGPIATFQNVKMYYSDSALVKVEMKAETQNEYENGDRIFPKGIDLQFFDADGSVNSTLTSNHAKLDKKTGIYTVKGNVIIIGIKEYKKVNTEELLWNPATKRVFTDKFVRIETKEEILTGNGLNASQDFKSYKIINPTGVFSVKEN
jgi:LPS export ABC transporter protein LptC